LASGQEAPRHNECNGDITPTIPLRDPSRYLTRDLEHRTVAVGAAIVCRTEEVAVGVEGQTGHGDTPVLTRGGTSSVLMLIVN
jgi:hypothetical protein